MTKERKLLTSVLLKEGAETFVRQLNNVDALPSFEEAVATIQAISPPEDFSLSASANPGFFWGSFLKQRGLYTVLTQELIQELAAEFHRRSLDTESAIEVCAGNGLLSHHLRKTGVNIRAIDDGSDKKTASGNLTEKLAHKEALEKYQPRVVVGNWIPAVAEIGQDILAFPSVDYFFDMGERAGNATWLPRTYTHPDFQMLGLEDVSKYTLGTSDYFSPEGPSESEVLIRYTEARLWKRIRTK